MRYSGDITILPTGTYSIKSLFSWCQCQTKTIQGKKDTDQYPSWILMEYPQLNTCKQYNSILNRSYTTTSGIYARIQWLIFDTFHFPSVMDQHMKCPDHQYAKRERMLSPQICYLSGLWRSFGDVSVLQSSVLLCLHSCGPGGLCKAPRPSHSQGK